MNNDTIPAGDKDGNYRTSVYMPKDMLKKLRTIALNSPKHTSVNTLILAALSMYLKSKDAKPVDKETDQSYDLLIEQSVAGEIPAECKEWVTQLMYILGENDQYAVPAVKESLRACARLTLINGGKHVDHQDAPFDKTVETAIKHTEVAATAVEQVSKRLRPVRKRNRGVA